jgi:hypothetical protein
MLIEKRFLYPVSLIPQPQSVADLIKDPFFSVEACQPGCIIFIRPVLAKVVQGSVLCSS